MKKLILFELLLLFLATTFKSDSTGGWVQQTLPVNKFVNDIFFVDSLTGWCVTTGGSSSTDTGYVMKTTNGGTNWAIQLDSAFKFYTVQFLNSNTGYAAGGTGRAKFLKTTNSGNIWTVTTPFGSGIYAILDMSFVNADTGWICSDDPFGGGVFKTSNGGTNWVQELTNVSVPSKLFFLNKDTGWVICQTTKLLKTIDGGLNWIQIFSAFNTLAKEDLFFASRDTGWVLCQNPNTIYKTINGGFNWQQQVDPEPTGSDVSKMQMINPKLGYISAGVITHILKTTDGVNWFSQNAPNGAHRCLSFTDSLTGWAGGWTGTMSFVSHTSDGGGPPVGIHQIGNEIPKDFVLYQNYPNPFNPKTVISYQLRVNSYTKLTVYDITGKHITNLVNQKQNTGTYEVDIDGSNLPSGVYFYNLIVDGILIDTKKMVLLK